MVLISCLVFGWFVLLADEYKLLGKHVAAGAGFVSNIVLWGESGYFDSAAETKPLLHLWSLGIEEQFYIVWPLLLWLAAKSRVSFLYLTILVALVSFVLNIYGISKDAVATFYSPQTRFWELLCGGLLAWAVLHKRSTLSGLHGFHANALAFSGACLLGVGMLVTNKSSAFPGWFAVLPVLGAVLVILAGAQAWLNRVILSNRIMVGIGLISFPLYLWHWPLLSFAQIVESETPGRSTRFGLVALSIALAWLTYVLIERPLRFGKKSRLSAAVLLIVMIATGYAGYQTYVHDGFGFRDEDRNIFLGHFENSRPQMRYFQQLDMDQKWHSECAYFDAPRYKLGLLEGVTDSKPLESLDRSCYVRDKTFDKSVLIWGDSHAQALAPGIRENIPRNWQVLQVATSACTPDPHVERPSATSQCDQSNYFALQTIRDAKPDVVVVAQLEGHGLRSQAEIADKLRSLGVKKILFIGPTPRWSSDLPTLLARKLWVTKPRRTFLGVDMNMLDKNRDLAGKFKPDDVQQFVNVMDVFCNQDGCLTYLGDDIMRGVTTWDYGHLTPIASDYLARNILIEKIVGK